MKVLFFSDLHYLMQPEYQQMFSKAVEHAVRNHGDAQQCIILGDLTKDGMVEEYTALAEALRCLPMPVNLMLGNHDHRYNFFQVFGKETESDHGFAQFSFDAGCLQFILLDTKASAGDHGELDEKRLGWLEEQLKDTQKPCCICLHHHPVLTGLPAFDAIGLRSPNFISLLKRYREHIHLVVHGHCHMALSGAVEGIPVTGVSSLYSQSEPVFNTPCFSNRLNPSLSYSVLISDGVQTVIHTINIDD